MVFGATEALLADGVAVRFEQQGRALFVSHQWVERQHPDPRMEQIRVLQDHYSPPIKLR